MIQHVYPVNDLEKHDLTTSKTKIHITDKEDGFYIIDICYCKCKPIYGKTGNNLIVTHNSFDGREAVELANEILNK